MNDVLLPPLHGAHHPSTDREGTGPGSFALAPELGGPKTFSSPDTPGMPAPSDKTAWDFMPTDWRRVEGRWLPPEGFTPVTQLEHARLGTVTTEMRRVAEREPHLTAEQVRDDYVTPKEHVGLPKRDDVKQGCVAYRIAAHAADVALGIPGTRDWDDDLTKARAALNWERHCDLAFDGDFARALHDEDLDVDTDFCAMCGHDWCSVRISKEIVEFASGKAERFARDGVVPSPALSEEQRAVLEQRGVLSLDDLHRLADKTRKTMGDCASSPACHSAKVDDATAQQVQSARLVPVERLTQNPAE